MRIRVATANLYVNNEDPAQGIRNLVNALRPTRPPDSIGIQEGGKHLPELRTLEDYQLVADGGGDLFERSNPILVHNRFTLLDAEFIPAAAGTGTSTSRPRNIAIARYLKQGVQVAHINTHLHVVPEDEIVFRGVSGRIMLNRRETQYVRHVERLLSEIDRVRDEGFVVFVTADGNTRPRTKVPDWEFALYKALASRGKLKVERKGVDIVAYDAKQVRKLERKEVDRKITGSDDHDAIFISTERIPA